MMMGTIAVLISQNVAQKNLVRKMSIQHVFGIGLSEPSLFSRLNN